MGGLNSLDNRKQVKGGIHIQINKTTFISNETIEGTLHINLQEQYQGHILVVSLEGIEQTTFRYRQGTGSNKSTNSGKGIKRFLNYSTPIYDFAIDLGSQTSYVMQPGQWSIPFSIKIGDKLPSSMDYQLSIFNKCSLKYNICAYIINSDQSFKPIQGNQEILIGQKITKNIQNNSISQKINPVVCFCCQQGVISFECSLDQNIYSPGEQIVLKAQINGCNCKTRLKGITIQVKGNLAMKAKNTINTCYRTIDVYKQEQAIQNNFFEESITIPLPTKMNHNCKGELIELLHTLTITPQLDNLIITNGDYNIITFNIDIQPKSSDFLNLPAPKMNIVQTPISWNPIQLEQQQYSDFQQLNIQQINLQFSEIQQEYMYLPMFQQSDLADSEDDS